MANVVRYSENNSGGFWRVTDSMWSALEAEGWRVDRVFREAFIDLPLSQAIDLWSAVTGLNPTDSGCSCCGQPHEFYVVEKDEWEDDAPKVQKGEKMDLPTTYVVGNTVISSKEDAEKVASMSPRLGAGVSREVFDLGNAVLKISRRDKREWAGDCNITEAQTWANSPRDIRRHLAPVLAADPEGSWLIMAKVKLPSDAQVDAFEGMHPKPENVKVLPTIKAHMKILNRISWDARLDKGSRTNVGWYKGALVLLDYGFIGAF